MPQENFLLQRQNQDVYKRQEWGKDRNQMPTLEYILIRDVNDSLNDASHLVRIAKRLPATVNLIPYNTVEGLPWERPAESRCRAFRDAVHKAVSYTHLDVYKRQNMSTAFTVSGDAAHDITTGISAAERALTIRTLADPKACLLYTSRCV